MTLIPTFSMLKFCKYFVLCIGLICSGLSYGQTYQMTVSNETYADLKGSTSLNNNMTWDDPVISIPIGFNFTYFSLTLDTLYLSEWGFGGELVSRPGLEGETALLIPCGADLMDRGYDFGVDEPTEESLSKISYKLDGEVGKRIFKLEWNNAGFYTEIEDDDKSDDYINFQLWLYEETNTIEIHYGPNSVQYPDLSYDGESGIYVGFFEAYDLTEDLASKDGLVVSGKPTSATLVGAEDVYTEFIDGTIPDGTVYKFEPDESSTVKNEIAGNDLTIYPNPVTNEFAVQSHNEVAKVVIRSIEGKEIAIINEGFDTISTEGWVEGVYTIEVHSLDSVVSSKIVKL